LTNLSKGSTYSAVVPLTAMVLEPLIYLVIPNTWTWTWSVM